ncbi:hypothetical protein D3C87_2184600 [compost metagenome]
MIHQIETIGDLGCKAEILFHQKHGHATLFQLHQHIADALDDDRRKAFRRLIKQ